MTQFDYDLFVIGAGSGGVRAARLAAATGAKVAIAESQHFGGTCVNIGCVPKKLMVYAAHVREEIDDAAGLGWSIDKSIFDWPTFIARKNKQIQRLNEIYTNLLEKSGVTILIGHAALRDAHTLTVGDQTITAQNILIATGSRPRLPEISGGELAITSDQAFFLDELPRRVLIVGGGYIGVEFAGIFHGLGSRVTQLYYGPMFLRGFDYEVRSLLAEQMLARGIDLRFERDVVHIARTTEGALRVELNDESHLEVDQVLYAIGRVPNTQELSLEDVGIDTAQNGAVMVDRYSRTCVENIYAIGDCTDRMNLTPVAIAEAHAMVKTIFDNTPTAMDYHNIATAVFSSPPMASVGLTESEARDDIEAVDVYHSRFSPLKNAMSGRDEKTLMKLIVDATTDRVVGAHMLGPDSAEIMQGVAIAVRAGLTKKDFDATVAIHPTAAEEFVTMRNKG